MSESVHTVPKAPRHREPATLRNARLEFRLPREARERIEKAALASGQSLSDFAASAVLREADAVLERQHTTTLSQRDWARFVELLASPPPPVQALTRAVAAYDTLAVVEGDVSTIDIAAWSVAVAEDSIPADPH